VGDLKWQLWKINGRVGAGVLGVSNIPEWLILYFYNSNLKLLINSAKIPILTEF
jgi:hypothetical protein